MISLKKIYESLLVEKTLYHGTLNDNVRDIKKHGLQPLAGDFVKDMYDEYEDAGIEFPELTFATDKEQLSKAVNAITHQIAKKLNKGFHDVTDQEFINHGAIIKIHDGDRLMKQRPREDDHRKEYPHTVEPGDYYSEESILIDDVLIGKSMIRLLKRYGNWPRNFGPNPNKEKNTKQELIRLAIQRHPEVSKNDILSKINSLSSQEIDDFYRKYK
jgi:hypothetical protein